MGRCPLTHLALLQYIVHHLRGTQEFKLRPGGQNIVSTGYTDTSYSHKQNTISTPTCEAEYIADSDSYKETIWFCALIETIKIPQTKVTPLRCNNNAAIVLSSDPLSVRGHPSTSLPPLSSSYSLLYSHCKLVDSYCC
jgi:hypothetical protein